MPLFLCLETTGPKTSISLAEDGIQMDYIEEPMANMHASHLTVLIDTITQKNNIPLKKLSAVSISKGPGSYTGLRVGSATAKGLCLALNIPLIAIDTLLSLFDGLRLIYKNDFSFDQYCPSLDARRWEVFIGLFDPEGKPQMLTEAKIIDHENLKHLLGKKTLFFGSGAKKIEMLYGNQPNAFFEMGIEPNAAFLGRLTYKAFLEKRFENLISFVPNYLKEFYSTLA